MAYANRLLRSPVKPHNEPHDDEEEHEMNSSRSSSADRTKDDYFMLCSTNSRSNEEPERRVPRVIRQVEATLKEPDKIAPLPTARFCGIGLPVCTL